MTDANFEAWLRTVCFRPPTREAYDLAKSAWRDAPDKASQVKNDVSHELPGELALAEAVRRGEWPHTMDAQAWVTAWMVQLKQTPDIYKDEGTMLAWFANAIMAGYDTAMLRAKIMMDKTK